MATLPDEPGSGASTSPDLFSMLPEEMWLKVASSMSPNNVVCVLRTLNRAARACFSAPEHRTVHLSKPVPTDAFARRFGSPGAMRGLTRRKRYKLLRLVAGSGGNVANLAVGLRAAGLSCLPLCVFVDAARRGCLKTCQLLWRQDCDVPVEIRDRNGMYEAAVSGNVEICIWLHEELGVAWPSMASVMDGAAKAGHLAACKLLHDKHDIPYTEAVMVASARAGDLALCQSLHQEGYPSGGRTFKAAVQGGHRAVHSWLLDSGAVSHIEAAAAAAEAGNVRLLNELLDDEAAYASSPAKWWNSVLAAAAEGCDLPTLQALFERAAASCTKDGRPFRILYHIKSFILAAAVNSLTPDWQAKAEWLLAEPQGFRAAWDKMKYQITHERFGAQDTVAEAVARLTWLQDVGLLDKEQLGNDMWRQLLMKAISLGDFASVELILGAGVKITDWAVQSAASAERWETVGLLLVRCGAGARSLSEIVQRGPPMSLMEQLLGMLGAEVVLSRRVFLEAVESGSVEVMTWFLERGFQLDGEVFVAAVRGGCEEALEWLAERGCDMGADGAAYVEAARHGDLLILDCLRRLGCPFGTTTFAEACRLSPLAPLRWMAEQGFPVDWGAAEEKARQGGREGVGEWLRQRGSGEGPVGV